MTMKNSRVGLWCADNVIRCTDGTVLRDVTAPQRLLASIMSGGKLTVYVTDPELLDPFIAHVVHSLPHNEHNANLSWDAIVSEKAKFFSFTVRIDRENSARFSTSRIFCVRTAVSP